MKRFLIALFLLAAIPVAVAQDLVVQMIWQDSEGTVIDAKYIRIDAGPGCSTDNQERILWSSRENADMLGRWFCIASGAPIPDVEIGEFTVTIPAPTPTPNPGG